jgi:uncharacterized protein YdhG (YjbR/CyaY superfamily)
MATNFRTVDEYIASCPNDVQPLLEKIRHAIHAAAPDAKEKISYQMPAFTLDGRILIYYAAWKKHVAVYGITGAWDEYKRELAPYRASKGTLQFSLDTPFPFVLLRKIVRFGVKEIRAKAPLPRGGAKATSRKKAVAKKAR